MKESYRMELYAQRAIRQRQKVQLQIQPEDRSSLLRYLDQGLLINKALASVPALERHKYILDHSELILSSDGAEGINVVWGPNSQVCTHRVLSAEMREEFKGAHYLGTWVRQLAPSQRAKLKAELQQRLEFRVQQREQDKNQIVIEFTTVDEPLPEFLTCKLEDEVPLFLR